jgi:ATP-binding cassette subfamily F protein uup
MPPVTFVALEGATKRHGVRTLLADVTAGITEGARIGVVGRNGSGKSTLVGVVAGTEPVEAGRVVRLGGLTVGVLPQQDAFPTDATLRSVVLGDRAEHAWAGDARIREVMDGLLGGIAAPAYRDGLDTRLARTSGGEARRAALARVLVADPDLLVLDEPTNHLDIEVVDWLAAHLSRRRGALLAVTHDRWFLDAVCTETWEVADGAVHRYDGGYAAYVLARAERERVSAATEERRQNLLRKELAWLRRGPPARTSKPKFRIDAANALIADEPPARDRLELQRFATTRLGKQVYDLEDVTLAPAPAAPEVLERQTLRLGPGDRVGLLGPNGAGKSTLLRLLAAGRAGELDLSAGPDVRHGVVRVGRTVDVAHLSQVLTDETGADQVLASLQRVREHVDVGGGRTLSARQLLEGFGFRGERLTTRVGDLSGGERRRLQLLRLLVGGPNVLLLDEPTNDLDVESLTVLEDLLDTWPGTLVVVSHDRYFLERTTDTLYALLGDGSLRYLTRGVDEYLQRRRTPAQERDPASRPAAPTGESPGSRSGGEIRSARKELARLERRTDKLRHQEQELHAQLAAAATDHERVLELSARLREVETERSAAEEAWLELAATLE